MSETQNESAITELTRFLSLYSLQEYATIMLEKGFDDIEFLKTMTLKEFNTMCEHIDITLEDKLTLLKALFSGIPTTTTYKTDS